MGRESSGKGRIQVVTNQPFYFSGTMVSGNVYFDLYQHFDADTLLIKIKGYEEAKWQERMTRVHHEGEPNERTEVYYEDRHGKNSFYCHKIPLYQWNHASVMMPGQYTFPFSFQLTQGIPGTFEEKGKHEGGDYKGVIKYKVKAEVEALKGEKIKNKQELIIREQVPPVLSSQKEKIVKPTTWCCISKGEAKMKCYFEKTTYVLGETARFIAELDNSKCDLNMEDMTSVFSRVLTMKSKDGRQFRMGSQLKRSVLPGVKSGKQERREAEIPMGQNIKQSTNGKLIDCQYFLTITANLDGCICCSSEPEVTAPIQIVSLPPANYGFVQPQNWNPHVYEPKQLFLTNQYLYQNNNANGQPQQPQQQYIPPQLQPGQMPQQQQYPQQPNFGQQQPQQGQVQPNQLQFGQQQPYQGQYQQPQQFGQQQPQFGQQQHQQGQVQQQNIQLQPMQGQNQQNGQQYPQTGQQQPQPGQQQPLSMGIQFQQTSYPLQGGQPQNNNQFIQNGVMPPPNMH